MTDSVYFPGPHPTWERRRPEEAGLDAAGLAEAAAFSVASETARAVDTLEALTEQNADEGKYGAVVGPTRPRGGVRRVGPTSCWRRTCSCSCCS